MEKILIAESEIRQAFEGIECPREYKDGVYHVLRNGYLDFALEQVISNGFAQNIVEAIRYYINYQIQKDKTKKPYKVFLGDIENTSNNTELYKKIDLKRGTEKTKNKGDLTRTFGVRGHDAIPKLFSGDLTFKLSKIIQKKQTVTQNELPFGGPDGELNFDVKNEQVKGVSYSQKLKDKHIQKIRSLWQSVVKTIKQDMFPSNTKTTKTLSSL